MPAGLVYLASHTSQLTELNGSVTRGHYLITNTLTQKLLYTLKDGGLKAEVECEADGAQASQSSQLLLIVHLIYI